LEKLSGLVVGFDDEQIGALLCQHVPDAAGVDLRRKPDAEDYIPIAQASVGQKATALFLILLAQTDGLLVIDQPEDDLDNAFISDDILPAIRVLKHQQQIVFATHNANMLVNAEAEKVIVLDTEPRDDAAEGLPGIRGRIEHQGGIDQRELRDRITTILEGGKEAFLARERKYRFAP
jgi:ABC-type cobalamin/Fe3+-siderophores transport system ATPase subunit